MPAMNAAFPGGPANYEAFVTYFPPLFLESSTLWTFDWQYQSRGMTTFPQFSGLWCLTNAPWPSMSYGQNDPADAGGAGAFMNYSSGMVGGDTEPFGPWWAGLGGSI